MKRLIAVLLILVTLISLGAVIPGSADGFNELPFYMVNWMGPTAVKFPENIAEMPKPALSIIKTGDTKITISLYDTTDIPEMAKKLKKEFDARPRGMRYLNFPLNIDQQAENVIYMDRTVGLFKDWIKEFFTEYNKIGGLIDGLILTTECLAVSADYIHSVYNNSTTIKNELEGTIITYPRNKNIYNNIVSDSRYATDVRPYLEERGFQFSDPKGDQSEIYPISDPSSREYAIWNTVMRNRISKYISDACAPFLKLYPNADVSNYGFSGSNQWDENTTENGKTYTGGNEKYAGNTANEVLSLAGPDIQKQYATPVAYNGAAYEKTLFNTFLYEVNAFKEMYSAANNKKISAWITGFNHQGGENRAESNMAYTPYYAEALFHIGMLDPQPFLGYVVAPRDTDENEDSYDYTDVMRNISEVLKELTRVAGYDDRKPIVVPRTWNSDFVISGMYAGGRNIWRITPNTSEGTTRESFKVKDQAPTFTIGGETVVFPQGKILQESSIYGTLTCGYWVETPANSMPVIITDTDRYEKNPSYEENFESYKEGTVFLNSTARNGDAWTVSGNSLVVREHNGNKALEMMGASTLEFAKLPKNITAGDSYAKQQLWEVTVTVPVSGELKVLSCGENDSGIRISGGKVYYDENTELASVTAEQTYIISREVDFRNEGSFTCTYTVKNADGSVVAQQQNVAMGQVTVPVESISFSCNKVDKAYIDNYRLRATGVTTELRLYEADTGMPVADTALTRTEDTVYRLSWMNASGEHQVAKIYNKETLLKTVEMPCGADGCVFGLVKGESKITVTVEKGTAPTLPNYDQGDFNWEPGQVPPPETTAPIQIEEETTAATEETTVPATTEGTATTPSVKPTTPAAPTAPKPTEPVAQEKGLSAGWIILIVIASILLLACGGFALCWFVIKPKWLMDLDLNKATLLASWGLIKSTWLAFWKLHKSVWVAIWGLAKSAWTESWRLNKSMLLEIWNNIKPKGGNNQ
ncbi:MAG: hypothetical protein IJA47_02350 [Oscillospiraceae bacterium]|nr:hypothetical protein [Oscillospiraceae bacterium]